MDNKGMKPSGRHWRPRTGRTAERTAVPGRGPTRAAILAISTSTRSSISARTPSSPASPGAVLEMGGDRLELAAGSPGDRSPPRSPILSSSSASSASRPRLTAWRRRSVASSTPCSAISASMPPTVRSADDAAAARRRVAFRDAEAARRCAAARRRRGRDAPRFRSIRRSAWRRSVPDGSRLPQPAPLWLTDGKQPGKICRTRQVRSRPRPARIAPHTKIDRHFNALRERRRWHGFR